MKTMAIALLCLLVTAVAVAQQEAPKITVDIRGATLADAIDKISEVAGVTILTDGKIVRSGIQFSVMDAPVEAALSAVCAPRQLGWTRLYVKSDPQKKLKGEDLGNLIRALEQLGDTSLIAIDGNTQAATAYLREEKPPQERFAQYAVEGSGYNLVYLISDLVPKPAPKKPAAQPTIDGLIGQSQQDYAVLGMLTPEQQQQYWTRQSELLRTLGRDMQVGQLTTSMRMFVDSDPDEAMQMIMEAFSRLTPEEREALQNKTGFSGG